MPVTSRSLPVGAARQSGNIRSVAYFGTAGILSVFMRGFASTPKARAQDNGQGGRPLRPYPARAQSGHRASPSLLQLGPRVVFCPTEHGHIGAP
jgi:hypothetical protein